MMCLSKPQKVLEYEKGYALVEFLGNIKKVRTPFPLKKDEYIISQAGIAVKRIPEEEATKMLKEWREMNDF